MDSTVKPAVDGIGGQTDMADPNQNIRTYNGIKEELITGLNNLRENGDLFDVTVVIGGQPFKAHKAVLASLSSYFQVRYTGMILSLKLRIHRPGADWGNSALLTLRFLGMLAFGKLHILLKKHFW